VTLPEVVTGELAGKFSEISLFDQHADFEIGSASNSSSTSPWAIVCEPATQPSHADSPPREHFTRGPRNSRAHAQAQPIHRAGKEPVVEYDSDSNTAPGYASYSNPPFSFYSDSAYEFDFGSDPEEPGSEDNSTEQPLSGPASGLVITLHPLGDSSTGQTASPQTWQTRIHATSPTSTHFPSWREHHSPAQRCTLQQTWRAPTPVLATPIAKSSWLPATHRCWCLNHSTSMGGTRSKVEGGDRHDLEPEGTRKDTRHGIYTGSGSQSSYPTSCLE
jgi:hypothetical protein